MSLTTCLWLCRNKGAKECDALRYTAVPQIWDTPVLISSIVKLLKSGYNSNDYRFRHNCWYKNVGL